MRRAATIAAMRRRSAISVFLCLPLWACGSTQEPAACGSAASPGAQALELEVQGRVRGAVVRVPASYDGVTPVPLVIAFPFFSGTPDALTSLTDVDEASEARGALLVLPEGVGASFNAGKCCGEAWETSVDDVAFTAALIDEASARYCVQGDQVVVTGMSNGALMAHRAGCELADRLRGIAAVAGPMHIEGACNPVRPLRVLQVHGTVDDQMPFQGGEGMPPIPVPGDLSFSAIPDSMERWRHALGCELTTEASFQAGDASCAVWRGCSAGAHLELCAIAGGGHTWPGGSFPAAFGATSHDLSAGAYLLDVLLR
jgi:polyhydroxybutyrate depolymerase